MTPDQRLPMIKPGSIKTRFAYGFLRALKRLNKHTTTSPSSPKEIFRRYRRVKMASDASMAFSVGPRRVWSRSMIWKLRSQARGIRRRRRRRRRRRVVGKKLVRKDIGFGGTDELRNLVPGGETMDLNSLLEETAHYIKCLTTQVQVMRNIVDFCTP